MKKLQRARYDSKNLRRRIIDPNSITKALKFSKRFLEKIGIAIRCDLNKG